MNQTLPCCAKFALAISMAWLLVGCQSTPNSAPVVDRQVPVKAPSPTTATKTPRGMSAAQMGLENAGKPGYYTVKPSDTLVRIALDTGQNWKDLVRWNGLENPNIIEVGQVLRVAPPGVDPPVVAARPVSVAKVDTKPLDLKTVPVTAPLPTSPPGPVTASASAPATASANGAAPVASAPPAAAAATPAAPAPVAVPQGDDLVTWMWPANGAVTTSFDDNKSKGLAISGKAGDPVFAAADGKVVYAGSGLRGYGNLVIVKHNTTYLTAYAHNQVLLVKEDQSVRRGQKIAEMGSTDADRVQLHFEIRKQGKPIDPSRLLPSR
jgi:lipoprotein NlpD